MASLHTTLFVLPILPLLGACGGSGNNDPFAAEPPIPAVYTNDDVTLDDAKAQNIDFPVRMVIGDNTHPQGTIRQEIWGLRFNEGGDSITLIRDDEEIVLTETIGEPGGGSSGYNVTIGTLLQHADLNGRLDETDEKLSFFGVFGFEAQPEVVAGRVHVARYDGEARFKSNAGGETWSVEGTSNILVDFDEGTASGAVMVFEDGSAFELKDGRVADNGISGDLQMTGLINDYWTFKEGEANGTFYGPGATQLAGTYEGSATVEGEPTDFAGTFYGLESP